MATGIAVPANCASPSNSVDPVRVLQLASAFVLNAAFAWLVGALLTRRWLAGHPQMHLRSDHLLRRSSIGAACVCLAASAATLWAGAAAMGGVSLAEVVPMLPMVITDTAYGRACAAAMAVMACVALVAGRRDWQRWDLVAGVLLLLFAMSRALISHAAEDGWLSAPYAIEVLHLLLIAVWSGAVALAAWVVLPAAGAVPIGAYLASLSRTATVALAGIVASGLFHALARIGSPVHLVEHPYGVALSVKLVLVAMAVLLGAYNRFAGFPAAARGRASTALFVLRLESAVLLGALAAAALLASTEPPG